MTIVQEAPRVAMREDPDVTEAIEAALKEDGIDVRTGVKPLRVGGKSGSSVTVELDDGSRVEGTICWSRRAGCRAHRVSGSMWRA